MFGIGSRWKRRFTGGIAALLTVMTTQLSAQSCEYEQWVLQIAHQTGKALDEIALSGSTPRRDKLLQLFERAGSTKLTVAMQLEGYEAYSDLVHKHISTAVLLLKGRAGHDVGGYEQIAQVIRLRSTSSQLLAAASRIECGARLSERRLPEQATDINAKNRSTPRLASALSPAPRQSDDRTTHSSMPKAQTSFRDRLPTLGFKIDLQAVIFVVSLAAIAMTFVLSVKRARALERKFERHLCHLPCQVELEGKTSDCMMLDISMMGAMLNASLEIGDKLEIHAEAFSIKGCVAWSNAHYSGVLFETALRASQIEKALHKVPAKVA